MSSFDKYSNYDNDAGVTGVIFGAEVPVLEVELNEMQEIQKTFLGNVLKNLIGNGISDKKAITYLNNTLLISGCFFAVNGYLVHCNGLSISAKSGDSIYLQVWEDTVDYTATLKKAGNEQSTDTVPNYIKDSRIGVETSRRKVVKYTLMTTTDSNKENLPIATISDEGITLLVKEVNLTNLSDRLSEFIIEVANTYLPLTGGSIRGDLDVSGAIKGNLIGNAKTATSADKLNTDAGSATQPIYFKDGKPVATTYALAKSVPSDAKFTDTTYSALKNPYALIVQANGTSLGSYDGSSAKTFNITPSNIGASSSNHTHSDYATKASPTFTGSISLNRKSGSTIGTNSIVTGGSDYAGNANIASGENSAVIGGFANDAINDNDVVIGGRYNNAKSEGSFGSMIIGGMENTANGNFSVIIGGNGNTTNASSSAIIAGDDCITNGISGLATGYNVTALQYQLATGHYNNTNTATENNFMGAGTGTAFVIGNGSDDGNSNAFRVRSDGQIYSAKTTVATGADYAEYFEWADGNVEKEDRVGKFVTFDEDNPEKIRFANENDYILGIISGLPSVIGNGDEDWRKRYILDDFGRYIEESCEIELEDKNGEKFTRKYIKWKENPDYDKTQQYITRDERPEWAAVGMLGVLSVRDDGTCQVNGYCKCTDGGIATVCEKGEGYRVIKRVTDNIIKVVLK